MDAAQRPAAIRMHLLAAFKFLVLLILLAVPGTTASASELNQPRNEVILKVSGLIGKTNAGAEAHLDLAMIEALPAVSFTTETPWTKKAEVFTGIRFEDLVALVGATGQTIRARALNDYHVSFPVQTVIDYGAIIAYQRDGQYLGVRDRGPLWVMFPFTDRPELLREEVMHYSIWSVADIAFE